MKTIQQENEWTFTIDPITTTGSKKQQKKKKRSNHLIDLELITKELSHYLIKTGQSNTTTLECVVNLMIGLNEYSLEKIEKLEILNYLPRTIVTLYSIIEECDQRFSNEDCEAILKLVDEQFPAPIIEDQEGKDEEVGQEVESGLEDAEQLEESYADEDVIMNEDELEPEIYTRKTGDEVTIED